MVTRQHGIVKNLRLIFSYKLALYSEIKLYFLLFYLFLPLNLGCHYAKSKIYQNRNINTYVHKVIQILIFGNTD